MRNALRRKTRINVSIYPSVLRLAKALAAREHRSLSNWIESRVVLETQKKVVQP
jgi:hypothetical protein